jgi:transmembrane sensor
VSEGAVIYNPARQNARIEPGHILTFDRASATYELANIPLDQVGEWREGRLTFLRAPLADVAADIARASGIDYQASETSGERPISGSIALDPLRADPAALGPLLGVSVERRGETWILASR